MTRTLALAAVALWPAGAAAQGYALRVDPTEVALAPGDAGAVSLTIAPAAGHAIDRDGPLRVRLAAAPAGGIELARAHYRRGDAADAEADAPRFDLRFRAAAAGDYELAVDARFWLCRRYTCRAVRESRRIPVRVRAPAPPPPPPPPPSP
jgi:hypothetical protein